MLTSLAIIEAQIKMYTEIPSTPRQMSITYKTNAKGSGGVISSEHAQYHGGGSGKPSMLSNKYTGLVKKQIEEKDFNLELFYDDPRLECLWWLKLIIPRRQKQRLPGV